MAESDPEDSEDESEEEEILLELSRKLKAQPIISVAGYIPDPVTEDDSAKYSGRMSVLLPLPDLPGTRTGLPVVVNGFFALSEDRRAVKYQTSDDSSDQVQLFLVVSIQLASVHFRLCGRRSSCRCWCPGATPSSSPHCPD